VNALPASSARPLPARAAPGGGSGFAGSRRGAGGDGRADHHGGDRQPAAPGGLATFAGNVTGMTGTYPALARVPRRPHCRQAIPVLRSKALAGQSASTDVGRGTTSTS